MLMEQKRRQEYRLNLDTKRVEQLLAAYGTRDPDELFERMMDHEVHRLRFQPRPRRGMLRSVDQS